MKNLFLFSILFLLGSHLEASEKRVVTSDGVELYVKVEGSGPPLLYVHGGPGSASLWFEELFGDVVEQHFTVVYLDQRGVGRSTSPEDGNYSLDRVVQDFEEVRKELGFKSWLTLGHSFGGILQMGYSRKHPEVLKGMIMVNCTIDIKRSACESWLPKAAEFVGEKYSCSGDTIPLSQRMNEFGGKLREQNLFWKMGSSNPGTFEKLDQITGEIKNFNYDFSNHALSNPEYWENFTPYTAKMQMPVLYFYGATDFMVGPAHHKALGFPRLLLWKNKGGHVPFVEDKKDLERAILTYARKYNLI